MSLDILSQPSAYDRPFPKIGCGLKLCFEETEFEVTPGIASDIEVVLDLFANIQAGDILFLHGYKFTFVSGTPANLNQVQFTNSATTAVNFFNTLAQIPFFIDNYNVTNPVAYLVKLTYVYNEQDVNYFFDAQTANASAIVINPFSSPTEGVNPVLKEDYYVFMDIRDAETKELVCMDALAKPINVPASGNPKACFDLQPILERYPLIFTAPPLPYQTVLQGVSRPDNFDANYIRDFEIRVWNSYKDPDSTESCEKVQSDFYELPVSSQTIKIANFIQKETQCAENGFFYYSYPNFGQTQEWITAMPEDYLLCQDSAVELRFDYDVKTINLLGGNVYMNLFVKFTDGTSINNITQWDRSETGVQVANLSFGFGTGGNWTIQLPALFAGKKIDYVDISVFHIVFATTFYLMKPKRLYFDNRLLGTVKCCDDHKHFYFLSTVGNNDIIIGKDIEINLDVEYYTVAREQKCCDAYYGVNQYNSGNRNAALKEDSKVYKTIIEGSGDYIDEFLLSPFKWMYEPETASIFAIIPTESSYTIWQKQGRNIIEFSYKKSLIRKHFQL